MLLKEQHEEQWLCDPKKFWNIITSRDKPEHLRYVGPLSGGRARKSNSQKSITLGEDVYMSLLPLDIIGKSSNNISCFNLLWVDLDFKDCYRPFEVGIEYRLKELDIPPNIIMFSGRGIWALWFIEPITKEQWYQQQKQLAIEIKTKIKAKGMKVDTKVISPLKFIRVRF